MGGLSGNHSAGPGGHGNGPAAEHIKTMSTASRSRCEDILRSKEVVKCRAAPRAEGAASGSLC